ncbi:MAG: hypothetical protein IJA10_15290 [Lachnospiraceae bacterium]|nr:hypothetical protein [Lachnospiraceae bacterium]
MKKILKRAIFLMMTVGLFVSICGCGNLKSPVQQEKENEEKCQLTLELLKEKYEEDFEILSYFYDGGFNALCYPVNHPEMIFDAYVPNGRISEDTYAEEILIRTLQQKCNEVLDELGIEYYCQPYIFYYEKYMGSGKFDMEGSKEYIEEYYSIDLVRDIRESEVMIEVYINMEDVYNIEELYNTIYDLAGVMSINTGSVAYVFSTEDEIEYIRRYFDNGVLNRGGEPVDTFYDAYAGIINYKVINTEYDDFKERFEEYQLRAKKEK